MWFPATRTESKGANGAPHAGVCVRREETSVKTAPWSRNMAVEAGKHVVPQVTFQISGY